MVMPARIACWLLAFSAIVRAEEINVSAAISLKETLTEIGRAYESETHDHVAFNFGSSGQLATQVRNGAPVDVFISAADKQVDDLVRDGAVDAKTRVVIAGNELVLIVARDAGDGALKRFEDLTDAKVKRVALGEPKTVPAGMYAMQALRAMKLDEALKPRMILTENVRQVLDYVRRGEVDAGIVYRTDAQEAGDAVRVVVSADPSTHEPIHYPAVVTTSTTHREAALKFVERLRSEKARTVLSAKGFTLPETERATTQPSTSASPRE
jgi:molybdate transport system substrate-binding protein